MFLMFEYDTWCADMMFEYGITWCAEAIYEERQKREAEAKKGNFCSLKYSGTDKNSTQLYKTLLYRHVFKILIYL